MRILACQWGDKFSTIGAFCWSEYIGASQRFGERQSHAIRLMLVHFTEVKAANCYFVGSKHVSVLTKLTCTWACYLKRNNLGTGTARFVCAPNWLFTVPVWLFQKPWLAHIQNFDKNLTTSPRAYRKPASRAFFYFYFLFPQASHTV